MKLSGSKNKLMFVTWRFPHFEDNQIVKKTNAQHNKLGVVVAVVLSSFSFVDLFFMTKSHLNCLQNAFLRMTQSTIHLDDFHVVHRSLRDSSTHQFFFLAFLLLYFQSP